MNGSHAVHIRVLSGVVLAIAFQTMAIASDASAVSEESAASMAGSASVVVSGSLFALTAAGSAVVASVETAGDGSVIVLRGLAGAGSASVRIAGGASVVVGSVVEVVALATGCALIHAGRMIAFVPNEIGRALVHRRAVSSGR